MFVVFPDVFVRDLLRRCPKFIKKNSDGTKGIMTPCPHCKSNKFVSFSSFNVQKWDRPPRHSMHADACRLHLCSVICSCGNPTCVGPRPKPGSKKAVTWDAVPASCVRRAFSVWLKDCFEQCPPEVQRRYLQHANGLGCNADFINLATSALTREILDDRNSYKSIQDTLERHYQTIATNAKDEYVDFVTQDGKAYTDGGAAQNSVANFFASTPAGRTAAIFLLVWPELEENVFRYKNGPPKEDAINKLFGLYFDIVEDELLRCEIFSFGCQHK
jgi:hypothetical protein